MSNFLLWYSTEHGNGFIDHGTSPSKKQGVGNNMAKQLKQAHRKRTRRPVGLKNFYLEKHFPAEAAAETKQPPSHQNLVLEASGEECGVVEGCRSARYQDIGKQCIESRPGSTEF